MEKHFYGQIKSDTKMDSDAIIKIPQKGTKAVGAVPFQKIHPCTSFTPKGCTLVPIST